MTALNSLPKVIGFVFLILVICISTSWLVYYVVLSPPIPLYPDTDIVFLVESSRTELGFVNQDGSDKSILDFKTKVSKPFWDKDGKTLYLLENIYQAVGFGRISVWKESQRKYSCSNWENESNIATFDNIAGFIPNSPANAIITSHYNQIWLVDMQSCKKVKVIIDEYDNLNKGAGVSISGGSLSPDGKFLLYTRETNRNLQNAVHAILKMDLSNGETIAIGEGANPRWSPDGSKIAYLQLDGIYVMSADGTQAKRIVAHDMRNDASSNGKEFDIVHPEPQWSPDGNWLIYHLWVFQSKDSSDADIFKLNIATGDEIKVADDGLYPYWRK